jgi:hypothetical protein
MIAKDWAILLIKSVLMWHDEEPASNALMSLTAVCIDETHAALAIATVVDILPLLTRDVSVDVAPEVSFFAAAVSESRPVAIVRQDFFPPL